MSTNVNIEVTGIKEALRTLQDMDKSARRQITRDFREIVHPLIKDAERYVPNGPPMSGWDRNWFPRGGTEPVLPLGSNLPREPARPGKYWAQTRTGRRRHGNWTRWESMMRAYVSGKRPVSFGGYTRNLAAFGVNWLSPTSVLFDTAGQSSTPQGAQMIKVLRERYGDTSRVMWKAWEQADDDVTGQIKDLIEEIMFKAGRAIALDREVQSKIKRV